MTEVMEAARIAARNWEGCKVAVNQTIDPAGTGEMVCGIIRSNRRRELDFDA